MVNTDFDRFKKEQRKHRPTYLRSEEPRTKPATNSEDNDRHNNGPSVGAAEREV
ncbi:hypothetical protein RZN25_04525 [Bacillaceae bacterium S4-13-56]